MREKLQIEVVKKGKVVLMRPHIIFRFPTLVCEFRIENEDGIFDGDYVQVDYGEEFSPKSWVEHYWPDKKPFIRVGAPVNSRAGMNVKATIKVLKRKKKR